MILIRKPFLHLGAFILTLALLFGLAACDLAGPTPSPAPSTLAPATPAATQETPATITPLPDQQQGTVILWHSWDEVDRPILEAILDAFQAVYPDVFLDVTYIPRENLKTRFELDAREGGGPTVLFGPAEWGPALYAAGLTPDLSEVVDQAVWDSLPQPALENVQFDGALVGLPYQMQGVVLVRNREIIPLAPETFDEMVTRAQDATQGDIIGAYLDRSFIYAGGHLLGLGGSLISPEGAPAFSSEQGLAWVGLLQAF
ncbi:MAG TPA: extracellular solute-binding protein, partial [Anaerolineales bacterium]|nr:extracellular solute-binding protein [Anaerolineales bacterium]